MDPPLLTPSSRLVFVCYFPRCYLGPGHFNIDADEHMKGNALDVLGNSLTNSPLLGFLVLIKGNSYFHFF